MIRVRVRARVFVYGFKNLENYYLGSVVSIMDTIKEGSCASVTYRDVCLRGERSYVTPSSVKVVQVGVSFARIAEY